GYAKARQIVCEEENVADVSIDTIWPMIKEQADSLVATRLRQ
ncbi:MAG: lipopolysaccharide heptosyltransferase family protein, partial [Raoultella planticola]